MSSRPGPGLLKQLYFKWKSLNLPWRKQFLVGADLNGNTFWEFKDQLAAGRWRRIVKYSRRPHFADVRISPQWHQWLRHTRHEAPSIQEQQYEISRQAMMRQLADEADERWRSQPSYLDSPDKSQAQPAVAITDSKPPDDPERQQGKDVKSMVGDEEEVREASEGRQGRAMKGWKEKGPSPWDRPQQGGPGERWEPASWIPGVAQRR